jgi:O-antigen/teichoic acid export membrane protein
MRSRALRGSAWTIAAYGIGQGMRLASNLILTRLLFPKVFGLTALVNVFLYGLHMLSDVGIVTSVIQNPKGDEPRFLDTAWTIQALRGIGLWLAACLIAWPVSLVYSEPQLARLLPVMAVTILIAAFNSTSLITLRRRVEIGKLSLIDLCAQVVSIGTSIALAYEWRSVWALVIGAIPADVVRLIASYRIREAVRNRFVWDREAAHSIFQFGKWIFGSSALFFIASQADRLYLGRLGGITVVGIYSISALFAESILAVVTNLTQGVLYPALSHVAREEPARVRSTYYRARLFLDGISLAPLGFLATTGAWVVSVLYDRRYAEAGWILQLLAVRVAFSAILTPCETCLFALGHTRWGFYRSFARMVWIVLAIPTGWWLFGLHGLVWAVALSEVPVLLMLWPPFRRLDLLDPLREGMAAALFVTGAAIGVLFLRGIHLLA